MFPNGNKRAASNRPNRTESEADHGQTEPNSTPQPTAKADKQNADTEAQTGTDRSRTTQHTHQHTQPRKTQPRQPKHKSQQEHPQKKDRKRDSITDMSRARQVPDGTLDTSVV